MCRVLVTFAQCGDPRGSCACCAREQNGRTAHLLACANGHLNVAQWLVTSTGTDARSENVGRVCAAVVSFFGRGDDLHGSAVCCVRGQTGHTALLLASALGHIDVVQWLVTSAGSDARSERSNVRR
jgi:ankyrin repeat protein